VLEGEGRQETPGGADSLRPGQIHFVRPGHAHRIVNENGLVFLNMAFEADLFGGLDAATGLAEPLWGAGGPIHAVTLQPPQLAGIRDAAVEAAHLPDRRSASWLLLEIARRVVRDEAPAGVAADMPDWFAEGLAQTEGADVLSAGLPALQRRMGRSPKHIARTFRRCLDLSPLEWLTGERIRKACLLLSTTRMSVLEIALACGFESPSHFHKCFRERMETTPLRYRKTLSRIQSGSS